jgi:LYR motif-containing protein 4
MASAAATAMAAPPFRAEVLSLLRSLLRTASKFNDYNVREYVKRRSLDAFRENKSLSDPSSLASAFSDGKAQLEVAKRQAVVYSLYAPKVKNIMEIGKI